MYTGDVLRPGPKEQVHIGPGKCMCQAGRGDLRVVTRALDLEGQVGCCEGAEKEGRALPMEALAWTGGLSSGDGWQCGGLACGRHSGGEAEGAGRAEQRAQKATLTQPRLAYRIRQGGRF